MGRQNLLIKFYNQIQVPNSRNKTYQIIYKFSNKKPSPHFFYKLTELTESLRHIGAHVDTSQRSIYITNDLHGAIIATKLALHYNAQVRVFEINEINSEDFSNKKDPFSDFDFRAD